MPEPERCGWVNISDSLYVEYHDREWGVPVHEDRKLFEFLILEGAQAGLSWRIILAKRDNFRRAFNNFEPERVAGFSDSRIEELLSDSGIIRNRLKIQSSVGNASAFLKVQEKFGSFDRYIWQFVNNRPIVNYWKSISEVPASTKESDAMSNDLRKRGFRFVGTTICYSFMQAVGMVNDHVITCFRHREILELQ